MQAFGFGYLSFGLWALINENVAANYSATVATISQSIAYSFDNLFHWIACFIYLKAAYTMPYLFNKNFYTQNEEILRDYQ